jgi:hypothetical protein
MRSVVSSAPLLFPPPRSPVPMSSLCVHSVLVGKSVQSEASILDSQHVEQFCKEEIVAHGGSGAVS